MADVDPPQPSSPALERSASGGVGSSLRLSGGITKPGAAKKITVKLIQPTQSQAGAAKHTHDWEVEKWNRLQSAVRAIHQLAPVTTTKEELYSSVEDFVIHKLAETLYKKLQDEVDGHLKAQAQRIKAEQHPTSDAFLQFLNKIWTNHCEHMLLIRSIFLSLDRKYALQTSGVRALWELGLQLFRHNIATVPDILRRSVQAVLSIIERDRSGETVDKPMLKSVIRMYISLQMYGEVFEKPFLDASEHFYASRAKQLINSLDTSHYMEEVDKRIEEENGRVFNFLDQSTKRPLIATVERVCIAAHVESIISKGLEPLLDANRNSDIHRMYNLLGRLGQLVTVPAEKKVDEKDRVALWRMKNAWNQYIKKKGEALIMDKEKDNQMVQELMTYKAKLDETLQVALQNHDQFAYALKEAFESFINKRTEAPTPAELIAKFLHKRLQSGSKITSDLELDHLLDKVMQIFRYINGKDVFEAFYKKDLAKRLLMGKFSSIDAEKAMIVRLKTECGAQFTSKLEGMFKDMDLSKELTAEFKAAQDTAMKTECSVSVLTTGHWPPYVPFEVKLPVELATFQDLFQQFYLRKFHGRRLNWISTHGTCILRAAFPKGRKELSVSFLQSTILLLFNEADEISYADIRTLAGMKDEGELKRNLQSLSLGKFKALIKSNPTSKEIGAEDTFTFNKAFTAKLFRIKINQVQLKETKEEQVKTQEGVFQDRIYQVDAAIVRVMKTRKTLSHTLLLTELFQQLKFPCKPADLKKRIETLIERDYIERDKDDSTIYHYKA